MSTRTRDSLAHTRCNLLSLGVAAALAVASHTARAAEPPTIAADLTAALPPYLHANDAVTGSASPKHVAATHQVANCDSSGPGSLEYVIAALDPAMTDGDVIDLTPLKFVCSKITVDAIPVHQNNLTIVGPGSKYLAIDGGNKHRLFRHLGSGTLAISGLTLANGYYAGPIAPIGGCLYSMGSVSLVDSDVSHCLVGTTSNNFAKGGGIYTLGNLQLLRSTITDSHVTGTGFTPVEGGGAYAHGDFISLYSTISNNTSTVDMAAAFGLGGALQVGGNVDIEKSTISGNVAEVVGALEIAGNASHAAKIIDSTISGNIATVEYGGIRTTLVPLTITNSTIAFNRSPNGSADKGDGLRSEAATLDLESTIISGNSDQSGEDDLAGTSTVSGNSNLVVSAPPSLPLPNDTGHDCPNLDLLADNGGLTLTHGLAPDSKAIDQGSADPNLMIDQRGAPRVNGTHPDIGAVEWKQDDKRERLLTSGFDGICDQ